MSLPASLPADLRLSDVWRPHAAAATANAKPAADGADPWGEDGFTFGDVLDIVNPLQHIPVVSTLYRRFTGDEIAPAAQFVGSGLLGGIPGLAVAGLNVAVEEATGSDIGETVLAVFLGDDASQPAPTTAYASLADEPPAKLAMAAQTPANRNDAVVTNSPGAAAGSETIVASAGLPSFFAQRPTTGPATDTAPLAPGAIRNNLFQPQSATRQAAIQANAPLPGANPPSASVNPPPPAPALNPPTAPSVLSPENAASAEDAKRVAANRAALLAVAKDLRSMVEGHQAYNTSERLKNLYKSQDGNLRPQQ